MPPFSAAERQKNVATAEGRGKHLSREPKPRQGRNPAALEKSFAPAGANERLRMQARQRAAINSGVQARFWHILANTAGNCVRALTFDLVAWVIGDMYL